MFWGLCLMDSWVFKEVIISACDGSKTIASANEVFPWVDSSDLKYLGLNDLGPATTEVAVQLCEIEKGDTFTKTFDLLGCPEMLCLTQHQIVEVCEKNPKWFRNSRYAIIFLTKRVWDNKLFFVGVDVGPGSRRVSVCQFKKDSVLNDYYRRLLVIPQIRET